MNRRMITNLTTAVGSLLIGVTASMAAENRPINAAESGSCVRDADDQIRYFSGYDPYFHERIRSMGFNLVSLANEPFAYDYAKGCVGKYDSQAVSNVFERLAADGMEAHCLLMSLKRVPYDIPSMQSFARIGKDGKPIAKPNNDRLKRKVKLTPRDMEPYIDAAHPGFREILARAAEAMGAEYAALGVPGLAGFRGLEEVRLTSEPSFTEYNRAEYRKATGQEIPPEVNKRACPHWRDVRSMPADRLIDDDFPLYSYYRWFWKTGDGWSGANDIAREAFEKGYGKKVMSFYAPGRRAPAIWGIGGNNSHLGDWFYLYPFPFGIQNKISELQANARGTGAKVIAGPDAIFKAFEALPKNKTPAKKPTWYATDANSAYITIPTDWLTEGFWLMLAKQMDAIGLVVARGVIGSAPGERRYWGRMTNPEALPALEKVMREVAVPLGPLLRNMPEHAPEVAVFESTAGCIFSGSSSFGWNSRVNRFGEYLTASKLPQYTLFSEEIAKNGIPESVKVIFLPMCDVLTKADAAKLEEFRRRGGRLVGEPTLAPGLKADATMPGEEAPIYKWSELFKGAETDAMVRKFAAEIRKLAAYEPYVDSDNQWILVTARSYGSADLVFAVNDRRTTGEYIGGWGTMLDKGVPNRGTVSVRRTAGAVYDLVRHEKVDFTCKNGKTLIPVEYETTDGRALLITERPLAPLKVSVAKGVITVTSSDKDVMIPIGIMDDNWNGLRYGILRDGKWSRPLPSGAMTVRNLATGEIFKWRKP